MRLGFKIEVLTRRRVLLSGLEPELSFTSLRSSLGSTQIEVHCRFELIVKVHHFTNLKHWLNLHFHFHFHFYLHLLLSLSRTFSFSLYIRAFFLSLLSLSLSLSLCMELRIRSDENPLLIIKRLEIRVVLCSREPAQISLRFTVANKESKKPKFQGAEKGTNVEAQGTTINSTISFFVCLFILFLFYSAEGVRISYFCNDPKILN